jgi:hypothetical protein
MKAAMTLGLAALLVTAGAGMAEQPMVLTEAQLDRVTAGQGVVLVLQKTGDDSLELSTADNVQIVFEPADPGTILDLRLAIPGTRGEVYVLTSDTTGPGGAR